MREWMVAAAGHRPLSVRLSVCVFECYFCADLHWDHTGRPVDGHCRRAVIVCTFPFVCAARIFLDSFFLMCGFYLRVSFIVKFLCRRMKREWLHSIADLFGIFSSMYYTIKLVFGGKFQLLLISFSHIFKR